MGLRWEICRECVTRWLEAFRDESGRVLERVDHEKVAGRFEYP
jgi:hypothetical protein